MKCLNCRGHDSMAKHVYIDRNGNLLSESELTAFEILHPEENNVFYKKVVLCGICYEEIMGKTDRMFKQLRATQSTRRKSTLVTQSIKKGKFKWGIPALWLLVASFIIYASVVSWNEQGNSGILIGESQKVVGSTLQSKDNTYVWPDGTTYEGEMKDGKLHGKGTLLWANGDKYTGDFFEGEITGVGALQFAKGGSYVGEFLNGKPHGQGTMFYPDNTRLEGNWVNGELE